MSDETQLMRLGRMIEVVEKLRAPGGCPWDREQTHASLRATLLEEAYEVLEAIDEKSADRMREELGDLLLQVVMQATIAREAGEFDIGQVADAVREKLVRRHPHVFGSVKVSGAEEVVRNWEALKAREYARESAMDGVQRALPALQWAWSLQRRAASVGFDWQDAQGAVEKVAEEVSELGAAPTPEEKEEELGDILFSLVNVARKMGLNPEDALRGSAGRFEARFRMMEKAAAADGRLLRGLSMEELDRYWESAKASRRQG
jgi:tetrapyrrole methylase family protein/MazG family protein